MRYKIVFNRKGKKLHKNDIYLRARICKIPQRVIIVVAARSDQFIESVDPHTYAHGALVKCVIAATLFVDFLHRLVHCHCDLIFRKHMHTLSERKRIKRQQRQSIQCCCCRLLNRHGKWYGLVLWPVLCNFLFQRSLLHINFNNVALILSSFFLWHFFFLFFFVFRFAFFRASLRGERKWVKANA